MRFAFIHPLIQPVLRATVDRPLAREVREQRRMRGHDPQALRSYSFERAIAFANSMSAQSAGYREKLRRDRIATPVTAQSWSSLPVLSKNDFRQESDSWYGELVRRESVTWMFTSGSTGEPFKFPISKASHTAQLAANELSLRAVGWNPSMRQAVVKAEAGKARGLRGLSLMIAGNSPVGLPAAEVLAVPAPQVVERIQRARIAYLRGYARTIYLFAQRIVHQELSCPIPLITTLGEGLPPEQAAVIERAFGGKVYRDYGGSEAAQIGFECREQRGYHIDLARYFIEILRDGRLATAGETGDIVVTAFRNAAMPLVRYRIGDIGRWGTDEPCPCGNTFPLLAEVVGRSADEVVTPSGRLVNVHTVIAVFKHAHEHIAEYKVIQKEHNRFVVLWVALHERAVDQIPPLHQTMLEKFGGEVSFDWQQVAEIPAERSGKRRTLVPLKSAGASPERVN